MREWLNTLGVGQYARAFEEAAIAADVLGDLTDADLASMGIPLGHRKRILKAIAAMVPAAEAGEVPALVQQGMGPATTAERRQLTVLFCDLVGSTALSQRLDPEELRGLIRAYQDACAGAVSRFGGHVAQYLGDGVLAYFGYPVALEAGAESAIRAGIEIQERMGDLAGQFAARRPGSDAIEVRARVVVDTGLVVIGHSLAFRGNPLRKGFSGASRPGCEFRTRRLRNRTTPRGGRIPTVEPSRSASHGAYREGSKPTTESGEQT